MNEDYLQRIWSQSRIPSPKLRLADGTPLVIKHPGNHNTAHSGPDFKEACVLFDELEFHGAIEIHVNGSDWYKHKHHEDEAYNNVILHVVYNNDLQIIQNGFSVPTLELKDFIDFKHFQKSFKLARNEQSLPCKTSMNQIDTIYWSSMKTKALIRKFDDKIANRHQMDAEELMYQLIAAIFGMGINSPAFRELAESLPWKSLKNLSATRRKQLILATSGCAQGDFTMKTGQQFQWHFKGTRPGNFPSVRIPQFARFVALADMSELIKIAESEELVPKFIAYCDKLADSSEDEILSKTLRYQLFINAFAPYLYWKAEQTKMEHYLEKALDLLASLPPESNTILHDWKKNGLGAQNAFDSQGLIALNRYYCSLKKCLSCEVGLKVLNRST